MAKFIKKILVRILLISVIAIGILTAVSAASLSSAAPLSINRMIIFGDSLSDNGNLYSLTIQIHAVNPTIPIIPNPFLYWDGRFTDGPVWNEYLASMIHFKPERLDPENRKNDQYQNYAYSGAWAETIQPDGITFTINSKLHNFPPPLSMQIDQYVEISKADNPKSYKQTLAHDLIFIWTGGNDYLNQEFNGPPVSRSPQISTDAVISVIDDNLKKLISAGNKNFVIINMPDLSKIPDIALKDPYHQSLAPNLALTTQLHNQKLRQLISNFRIEHPEINIILMDMNHLLNDQFQQAHVRQQQYAMLHGDQFQKSNAPCILETTDPDPSLISQIHLNHVLKMSVGPKINARLSKPFFTYPKCDLHKSNDQLSTFNYAEHYTAGGIFFDHIHPSTHVHAHIALNLCQLLEEKGYTFYQKRKNQYVKVFCKEYDFRSLINNITNPPFPLNY